MRENSNGYEWIEESNKKFALWEFLFYILWGFVFISFPIVAIVLMYNWELIMVNYAQFIKWFIVGFSTLPAFLFFGIKIQNKKYKDKRSN